jgi:hypothetical protein
MFIIDSILTPEKAAKIERVATSSTVAYRIEVLAQTRSYAKSNSL